MPLTDSQREEFDDSGYLILEGILDPEECQLLRDETDVLISDRIQKRRRMVVSYHEMAMLTSHPKIVGVLLELMGRRFAMHHIHCARHDEGTPGVGWHQDYEQIPQTNRSHLMVHVFYYLNGLNGTIGDLMIVPKSHRSVVERNALALFGTNDLPGSMTIDRLPPGTAVIVHSALWARASGTRRRERKFALLHRCVVLPKRHLVAFLSLHASNQRSGDSSRSREERSVRLDF